MIVTTQQQIDHLRAAGVAVAAAREAMLDAVQPGVATRELDAIGRSVLLAHGAVSAPESLYRFPGATCISVLPCVAHGIPDERVLQRGDVVNIDVSASVDGFFSDTGATMVVGFGKKAHQDAHLARTHPAMATIAVAEQALAHALQTVRAGMKLRSLGRSIEQFANRHGHEVIHNLTGHGVGLSLHEEPENVFNHYAPGEHRTLHKGIVIAIEPFVSSREMIVHNAADGWGLHVLHADTVVAQFEHTVVVMDGAPIVLTA
ncbi:MAG: type I methionyl aminopeptidase [Paenibacillaceae bacterium]|nr:type I methionyl aminopeptidase [Paenibacillaceae bacterium]